MKRKEVGDKRCAPKIYKGVVKVVVSRKKVSDSLILALNSKGKPTDFMLDKVEEYMDFWDIRQSLIKSLKKDKAVVEYNNGGGQTGKKTNPAIGELTKVSKQMQNILDGLKVDETVDDEDTGL